MTTHFLIQENGENVATIGVPHGMAGAFPIEAVSSYVESQGFARYDEYNDPEYILTNECLYCEVVFCNGYLTATPVAYEGTA